MHKDKRILVLLMALFPIALFFLLTKVHFSKVLPLDGTTAQAFVFPFVLVLLAQVSVFSHRINFWVITGGAVLGLFSIAYSFTSPLHIGRGGALIARLSSDELQTETRIFRERINKFLSYSTHVTAHSFFEEFDSYSEVRDFIENHPRISLVTWGSTRWINIAFRTEEPVSLKELGLETGFSDASSLKIIKSIPVIGMSYEPTNDTASFIADILVGVSDGGRKFTKEDRQLALQHAATQRATWSSFAHRTYAFWLLGNLYLEEAFQNEEISRGSLNCALDSYKRGLQFLRKNDNPELEAALYNNYAIALFLQAMFEGDIKFKETAFKHFKMAVRTLGQKNLFSVPYVAGVVAHENFVRASKFRFVILRKKGKKNRKLNQELKRKRQEGKVAKSNKRKKRNRK